MLTEFSFRMVQTTKRTHATIPNLNTFRIWAPTVSNYSISFCFSPIPSSRECLTLIFEEVRRKWEATEKKRMEEREAKCSRESDKEKELEGSTVRGTKLRKEIWIRPEGGRR